MSESGNITGDSLEGVSKIVNPCEDPSQLSDNAPSKQRASTSGVCEQSVAPRFDLESLIRATASPLRGDEVLLKAIATPFPSSGSEKVALSEGAAASRVSEGPDGSPVSDIEIDLSDSEEDTPILATTARNTAVRRQLVISDEEDDGGPPSGAQRSAVLAARVRI